MNTVRVILYKLYDHKGCFQQYEAVSEDSNYICISSADANGENQQYEGKAYRAKDWAEKHGFTLLTEYKDVESDVSDLKPQETQK